MEQFITINHFEPIIKVRAIIFFSNSDTEVIIKAYHCWGENVLSDLDGMFAFAIWDALY